MALTLFNYSINNYSHQLTRLFDMNSNFGSKKYSVNIRLEFRVFLNELILWSWFTQTSNNYTSQTHPKNLSILFNVNILSETLIYSELFPETNFVIYHFGNTYFEFKLNSKLNIFKLI